MSETDVRARRDARLQAHRFGRHIELNGLRVLDAEDGKTVPAGGHHSRG